MPKIEVRNLENKVVETIELADEIFGAPVNEGLMHDAVRQYLASRRAGTHSTQDSWRGPGERPQALASERHRPGSRWRCPESAVAEGWNGIRTEAAGLRI